MKAYMTTGRRLQLSRLAEVGVFLAVLIICRRVAASEVELCTTSIPVSEMTTKEDGIYRFMDGRELRGTVHMVGGCHDQKSFPTGRPYRKNYTALSYDASVSSDECIDKKRNDGSGVYDSFQGIVVESRGFQFQPELYVDDIDSLETKNVYNGELDSWKESSIVFGVSRGALVRPSLGLEDDSFLVVRTYTVPEDAINELGLGFLGEIDIEGAEFDENSEPHNCPFSTSAQRSLCRMRVTFQEPIDMLVILYAATHKANQDTNAVMFVSMLTLPCACLCEEHATKGVKYFPDPQTPGQCIRRVESEKKLRYKCDMLSDSHVCTYGYLENMDRTGPETADGHFPCEAAKSVAVTSHRDYNPSASFVL